MADFYLDHNAKQQIAHELRASGHTALTAISQKRDRASDPENLLTAVRQARIVITYDREDFRMLHDAWTRWHTTPAHFGILIIPQHWSSEQAAEQIGAFIRGHPTLRNELWEWRVSTGWRRFDPSIPARSK